ncbi:hypothetical protein KEM52_004896 [Ascosphaera acerosa]|nr:hypothetical protein KEM52_004896 [Ascosphaera acerosa]
MSLAVARQLASSVAAAADLSFGVPVKKRLRDRHGGRGDAGTPRHHHHRHAITIPLTLPAELTPPASATESSQPQGPAAPRDSPVGYHGLRDDSQHQSMLFGTGHEAYHAMLPGRPLGVPTPTAMDVEGDDDGMVEEASKPPPPHPPAEDDSAMTMTMTMNMAMNMNMNMNMSMDMEMNMDMEMAAAAAATAAPGQHGGGALVAYPTPQYHSEGYRTATSSFSSTSTASQSPPGADVGSSFSSSDGTATSVSASVSASALGADDAPAAWQLYASDPHAVASMDCVRAHPHSHSHSHSRASQQAQHQHQQLRHQAAHPHPHVHRFAAYDGVVPAIPCGMSPECAHGLSARSSGGDRKVPFGNSHSHSLGAGGVGAGIGVVVGAETLQWERLTPDSPPASHSVIYPFTVATLLQQQQQQEQEQRQAQLERQKRAMEMEQEQEREREREQCRTSRREAERRPSGHEGEDERTAEQEKKPALSDPPASASVSPHEPVWQRRCDAEAPETDMTEAVSDCQPHRDEHQCSGYADDDDEECEIDLKSLAPHHYQHQEPALALGADGPASDGGDENGDGIADENEFARV